MDSLERNNGIGVVSVDMCFRTNPERILLLTKLSGKIMPYTNKPMLNSLTNMDVQNAPYKSVWTVMIQVMRGN
jgi:hypothetical protein